MKPKTEEEIVSWLDEHGIKKYSIVKFKDNTLGVNVKGDVELSYAQFGPKIPVKFYRVSGSFWLDDSSVDTLQNSPEYVGKHFGITDTTISSLEGAPSFIGYNTKRATNFVGVFNMARSVITSLHGIQHHIKRLDGRLVFTHGVTNLLGIFLVPGISSVLVESFFIENETKEKLSEILNKHLQLRNRDIFSCQEDLIEAGFVEEAKL